VRILLPVAGKDMRIKAQIVYLGPLKPPVKEGDRVGELRIVSEVSGTSNSAPLYAAAGMEAAGTVGKGVDSILLGVNSYVTRSVTDFLKKRQEQKQQQQTQAPATASGPAHPKS
jgi:D-alanyl-D-alanine carboxypeptidase (penicillin-binding protein 5/6)